MAQGVTIKNELNTIYRLLQQSDVQKISNNKSLKEVVRVRDKDSRNKIKGSKPKAIEVLFNAW